MLKSQLSISFPEEPLNPQKETETEGPRLPVCPKSGLWTFSILTPCSQLQRHYRGSRLGATHLPGVRLGAGFGWAGPGCEILEERKGVVFGEFSRLGWLSRAGLFLTGITQGGPFV